MAQAPRSLVTFPKPPAADVEPRAFSHNLPAPPTPLIGREREIATLVEMLRRPEVRLLTLIGPPGIGKTRLGIQVATALLPDFTQGSYFVSLAPIVDPTLVVPTIAQTVGVKETAGQPLLQTLQSYLQHKRALLVLDNFEQVVAVAALLSELLAAAPQITLLVTSREVLRLSSEYTFAVPPLSLPPVLAPQGPPRMLAPPPAEHLAAYAAVQLFMQRATALTPDFALTDQTAATVAEICRRLDGLPLALELAAARIRHLSPQAILERLNDKLGLLTGGARDVPARHQTLRAAIEWSHSLLNEPEQTLFRRLAVFRGGRTLEAIEAVCTAEDDLEGVALEGVSSLLDKNLLNQQDRAGGELRYIMLETLHAYAREKLEESNEAQAIYWKHALYFTRLAERAAPDLRGPQQVAWLDRLEGELDNFRAALEWAYQHEIRLGLRLAAALGTFWNRRGYWSEGQAQTLALISRARLAGVGSSDAAPASLAGALYAAGFLCAMRQGDFTAARPLLDESVRIYQELPDREERRGLAESLNLLGIVVGRLDGMTARRTLHEDALAAAREMDDHWSVARSLYQLGHVGRLSGDTALGHAMFEESLALFRDLGDTFNIGLALIGVGQMAERRGDYDAARRVYEEGLALFRELGDKWGISGVLYSLGSTALGQQDYAGAWSLLEESLAVARELGSIGQIADVLENLGRTAYFLGDYAGAHALYNESMALFRESGDRYGSALCLADFAGVILAARTTGAAPARRRTGQGHAGGPAREPAIRVVQSLGAAHALFDSIGVQLDPTGRELFNRYSAAARAQLDEQAFAQAWAAGRALDLDQAIAWAQTTPLPQPAEAATQPPSAPPAMPWALSGLTRREQEVAVLVAEGKSNRVIADALVVGERTVEGHVSNILAKLGFRSRTQISAWVIKQGRAGHNH